MSWVFKEFKKLYLLVVDLTDLNKKDTVATRLHLQ